VTTECAGPGDLAVVLPQESGTGTGITKGRERSGMRFVGAADSADGERPAP